MVNAMAGKRFNLQSQLHHKYDPVTGIYIQNL